MALRRILPAVLALAACTPDVGTRTNPTSADYAVFDPSGGRLPLPNDLALRESSRAAQQGAQRELLDAFAATGGFPNDQEVPITIQFERQSLDRSGGITGTAPSPIDPATIRVNTGADATVLLLEKTSPTATPAPVNPATIASSYDATTGTLKIVPTRHAVTLSPGNVVQSTRWNAGSQYIVLVRGGANGVRTEGGGDVFQMKTLFVMTRGLDLSLPENERLLPVAPGSSGRQGRAITGAQLEQLRQSYLPLFNFVDTASGWGAHASQELLSIQTFQIAPVTGGAVLTDASAGKVPLPSDLLLDPATNRVVNNPGFGPLAAGLATLDGFSTTAMALAPTTAPVIAATVNKDTVFVYDLSNPAAPVRLKEVEEGTTAAPAQFWAEPYVMTQKPTGATTTAPCAVTDPRTGCFSTAIGLQPAAPAVKSDGTPVFLPPLKEGTEYAVLVTDGVKVAPAAPGGQPTSLQRSTLSRLLLFANPLVDANGVSQVSGQTNATAGGLEKIRQGVGAAAAALQAEKGIAKDRIVLGYTYRTQTFKQTALQLAAAPYQNSTAFVVTDAAPNTTVPLPPGAALYDVKFRSLNAIQASTGALNPDPAQWAPVVLDALVAAPPAAAVTASCPGSTTLKCAPLVVFHHGLTQWRGDMLGIAGALLAKGFVVAAVDAPLHGTRSFCSAVAPGSSAPVIANQCAGGAECTPVAGAATAADTSYVPGTCGAAGFQFTAPPPGGKPAVSGNFFVTGNLFRTRDTLRQDIIDNSALILAVARPPAPALPALANPGPLAQALGAAGIAVDPSKVYWVGQSLGAIAGTVSAAVNPRISRAVLNVGGGTFIDIGTNSPAFASTLNAVLGSLNPPIVAGTPEYLQFVNVAKWVLDPAEPVNFAPNLIQQPLPNLLAGGAAQPAKQVFGQWALCDATIPNAFNNELYANVGFPTATNQSLVTMYANGGAPAPTCPANGLTHGFLLDGVNAAFTGRVQTDTASWLENPSSVTAPAVFTP